MRDIDYDLAHLFGLDSKDMRKLMGAMSKLLELIDDKPALVKRFLGEEFPEIEKSAGRMMDFLVRAYMDQVQREKVAEAKLEAQKKAEEYRAKQRAKRTVKSGPYGRLGTAPPPSNSAVVGVDPRTGNVIAVSDDLKPFDLGKPSERSIIGLGSPIEAGDLHGGGITSNTASQKTKGK